MEYSFESACLFAHDIATKIDNLYVVNNLLNNSSPHNYYLKSTSLFRDYVIDCFKKSVIDSKLKYANLFVIGHDNLDTSILGIYIEHNNDVFIVVNNKANDCWRRFALIKELCSLYVNQDTNKGTNGNISTIKKYNSYVESLEKSLQMKHLYVKGLLNNGDLEPDMFAILLATELMIPPLHRGFESNLFKRLKSNGGDLTMNDIAKSLMIPEFVLNIHYEYFYELSCEFYKQLTTK